MQLDDAVDGLGAAVVRAVGVEVGQERLPPAAQGASQAGDLGDRAGVERVQDLLGAATALGRVLRAVGGSEVLDAAPGDVDLLVGGIGQDRGLEAGELAVGEVLGAGAQDGLDSEQGVALAAAVPGGVLLDSAAYLVDDLRAELDDVERVQDGGGVGELGVDRGLVATERVQGSDLDPRSEVDAAVEQPVGVGLLRAAGHQVQEPGVHASGLVTGQVDHPGQLLRAALTHVTVVPDVLIDPQGRHTGEPGRVTGQTFELGLDRAPQRRPADLQPAGEPSDRGVLAAQLSDCPPHRAAGQDAASGDQGRDLLGERPPRALDLAAAPTSLPPDDLDPNVAVRHVAQHPHPPAAAERDDPAVRAARQLPGRRDRHPHGDRVAINPLDSNAIEPEQKIAASAGIGGRARVGAPRSVRHVEVLANKSGSLVAPDPRGPRPLPAAQPAEPLTPHRNDEESNKGQAPGDFAARRAQGGGDPMRSTPPVLAGGAGRPAVRPATPGEQPASPPDPAELAHR